VLLKLLPEDGRERPKHVAIKIYKTYQLLRMTVPISHKYRYYFLSEGCFLKFAVLSLWGALSNEWSGLSFVFLSLVIYHYLCHHQCQASNWATLFLGDINMGTWPSRLGECQMRQ
jgi:hypothetical protein